MDTIEKELEIIAEYDDKLEIIKKYFPLKNSGKEVINDQEKDFTTIR